MIKKAYSRKRVVFYFSILLVVFTILTTPYVLSESIDESCHICFSKKNQRTNSQLTKQERNLFLDMCKYKAIDFIKINAEIDNRYPEYSDVKALLIALGKFEKKIDAELIVDFVELNNKGLIPSRKELIKMTKLNKPWKPPINAKEYWFTKRCPKPNDNETNWSIHFLTSSDDKSTLETKKPIDIISGYRSPATNHALRSKSGGVARKSKHMLGRAIDIRMEKVASKTIRDAAISLRQGGVGYYSKSNFVHLDTGNFRHW